MTAPMIPNAPECGAPCAEFEALAHTVAKLRDELQVTYVQRNNALAEVATLRTDNAALVAHRNQLRTDNAALRADRICWAEQASANATLALEQATRADAAEAELAEAHATLRGILQNLTYLRSYHNEELGEMVELLTSRSNFEAARTIKESLTVRPALKGGAK